MSKSESKTSSKRGSKTAPDIIDIQVTNPELFNASPRPGGYMRILVPPRSEPYDYEHGRTLKSSEGSEDCHCDSIEEFCLKRPNSLADSLRTGKGGGHIILPTLGSSSPGREFRLTRAIEETDWTIRGIDETDTMIEISNPLQDTLNMLAVTISCVMLMAAQVPNIGDEYFDWSKRYLDCIIEENDEDFSHPPNIQGLLNHMMYLKMGGNVTSGDSPKSKSSSQRRRDNQSDNGSLGGGGSTGRGGGAAGGSAGAGAGGRGGGGSVGNGSNRQQISNRVSYGSAGSAGKGAAGGGSQGGKRASDTAVQPPVNTLIAS